MTAYNEDMSAEGSLPIAAWSSIRRVQLITVAWMLVEVVIAIVASLRAHSVALLAFGGDSAIELLSAVVVLFRFAFTGLSELRAAKTTAVLLFLLAAFIVSISGLSLTGHLPASQPSYLGIALLLAAAAVMPGLARQKRRLARETGSSALAADAVQSAACAWLAWIALAGLLLNSLFKIPWADPAAALGIVPIVIKEGREAWQGKACRCA